MDKTIDNIVSQSSWTGREVGLVFLHSLEKDFLAIKNKTQKKEFITQEKFSKMLESLSDKEINEYKFYAELHSAIIDTTNLNQTYRQQFFNGYYRILFTFQEIERCEIALKSVINEISEDALFTLKHKLLTVESFLKSNEKVNEIKKNLILMTDAISYLNTTNDYMKSLFELLEVTFLDDILFDMSDFNKKIEILNQTFEKLISLSNKKQELDKIFKNIRIDNFHENKEFYEQIKTYYSSKDTMLYMFIKSIKKEIEKTKNNILISGDFFK